MKQRPTNPNRRSVAFGRNYFHPVTTPLPEDDEPISSTCSAQATLIVNRAGKVHCTGTLHGRVYRTWTPIEIPLPGKVIQVAAGRHFCMALLERSGAVVTWGAGHFGQLGVASPSSTFTARPWLVERLARAADSPIRAIAAGDWHALAVTSGEGRVWAWGSNRSVQCGVPAKATSGKATTVPEPLPVTSIPPMKDVAGGRSHTLALTKEGGDVFSWGASQYGQCGTGTMTRKTVPGLMPNLVDGLTTLEIVSIDAGGNHSIALSKAGRVFVWGDGSEGQLGLNSGDYSRIHTGATSKPRFVADLDFVAIEANHEFCKDESSKSLANILATAPKITSVYTSSAYCVAVSSSGHAYCWGSNDAGQLPVTIGEKNWYPDEAENSSDSMPSDIVSKIHIQSFDSRHNILLPTRLKELDSLRISSVALGPNHMWCFGQERSVGRDPVVGRTLYETHVLEAISAESETGSDHDQQRTAILDHPVQNELNKSPEDSRFHMQTVISDLPIGKEPVSDQLTPAASCLSDDMSGSSPITPNNKQSFQGETSVKRPSLIRRISKKLMRKRASFRSMGSDTSLSVAGGTGSEDRRTDVFTQSLRK